MHKNLLCLIAMMFFVASVNAQTVVKHFTGSSDVFSATVTVASGGLETVDIPLTMVGDDEDSNLIVKATSSAAITADVLGASSSDGEDNNWIAAAAPLIQFAAASSGSVDQASLEDLAPFARLSFDNNGAAEVVFEVTFSMGGQWLTQVEGRTPVLPKRYIMAQKTTTLAATTGSDITDFIDMDGKSNLVLFVEPGATGLVYDVLVSHVNGGPEMEIVSDSAVGASDTRILIPVDNGAKLGRLRLENPTGGAIAVTYSVVATP